VLFGPPHPLHNVFGESELIGYQAPLAAFGSAVAPAHGLVQRSLFAAWFGWCAGLGALFWQRRLPAHARP
jgi:hypothetical protein